MATELDNWSLEKWLKRIRMTKYKQAFIDNGYDTPELCANLNKEDLDVMEVTNKHHRSTLFTQSRKLLELVDKERYLALDGEEEEEPNISETTLANGNLQPMVHDKDKNRPGSSEDLPTATSNQPVLADYSEPWSGGGGANGVGSSGANAGPPKPVRRIISGSRGDTTDGGPSPSHKNIPNKNKKPPSPGGTNDSSTTKKDSSTGMTRLQFKLKIREELFHRNVVLSEAPYCREDGTADEALILELASDLSSKFDMEKQAVCDALKAEWSNDNNCPYNSSPVTPKLKEGKRESPKVELPVVMASRTQDNYDEPFDTTNPASPKMVTPSHRPLGSMGSAGSTDNYDEPFDTTNTPTLVVPPVHSSPGKKSATMPPPPSSATSDPSNYDEPFDTLSNKSSSPEKTREAQLKKESKTLPSPKHQRKELWEKGVNPNSPSRSASSKKFGLFKKKDKKDKKPRTMSLRDSDVQFLEDGSKDPTSASTHQGLIVTFASKSKNTSSEDVSGIHVSPSSEQLSFLQKGQTPPLPSPRPKIANGSSGDSDESPQLSGGNKKHGGRVFKKFITPPVSVKHPNEDSPNGGPRHANGRTKVRISRGSDDEDGDAWLTGSKSFEELSNQDEDDTDPRRKVHREKKSRTSKLISRFFKKKAGQSKIGGSTLMVNRCSAVSDDLPICRESSLTASISMPDITISHDGDTFKDPSHILHDYTEIEDAHRGSLKKNVIKQTEEGGVEKKKPLKPPPKSPRASPCHSPSPLSRSPVVSPPISISPSSLHHQVVIRGVSESSSPDQMTIPIIQPSSAPTMQFGSFSEAMKSGRPASTSSIGEPSVPPESPGHGSVMHTPSQSKGSQEEGEVEPKRLGSVSSTASDVSVGNASSTSKPAIKPKPAALASKRTVTTTKGQVRPIKPTTPQKPVVPPSPKNKTNPVVRSPLPDNTITSTTTTRVPPPKPARTLPRKSRNSADLSDSSGSTATSPSCTSNDGEDSSRFGVFVDPAGKRQAHSASSTPPMSPLSPLSPNTIPPSAAGTGAPPPKPARRARSLKDVRDDTSSTTSTKESKQQHSAADASKSSQTLPNYSGTALPSKFKPVSSMSTQSPSTLPKPIPRTRRT